MKRIALVHPFSWPDVRRGGERYLHDLSWWLPRQGIEVDVVVGAQPGQRPGVESPSPGLRLIRLRHPARLDAGNVTRLESFGAPAATWLARHRYDVVHALTPSAAVAAISTRHRTVYTALGHPTPESFAPRPLQRRLFVHAVRRCQTPLALSQSAAATIETIAGTRPAVLPPGVRADEFPANPAARTGPPRILFPAFATDPRKGLDRLLAAMPSVLEQFPELRLQIGGGGDPRWALETLTHETREQVVAATDHLGLGAADDLPARYAEATVTVLPSSDEAFGLVLVESLAAGTPVVASAAGGPAEIVTDNGVGVLTNVAEPAALADAMIRVIALAGQPETAWRCSQHALNWDWDNEIGPQHLAVYDDTRR